MHPLFQVLGRVLLGILLISIGLAPRILERVGDATGELAAMWTPLYSKPREVRIGFRQSRWLMVLGAAYMTAAAAAFFARECFESTRGEIPWLRRARATNGA
jgi:hypothetical protein